MIVVRLFDVEGSNSQVTVELDPHNDNVSKNGMTGMNMIEQKTDNKFVSGNSVWVGQFSVETVGLLVSFNKTRN